MKRITKLTALAAAISLSLAGCGGGSGSGSGDTAGIGGSGFISSGTITGFGSVFVNGVEFETDSATFDIEGDSSGTTQNDLAIGMVVRVNGTINPDGITGNATSIVFDDELQGPIAAGSLVRPTLDTTTFTVLGTNVEITRLQTSFDGTSFDFDSIAEGDNVEISGFFDASGKLLASRIELETDNKVEIKGEISGLVGTTFDLLNPTTLATVNIDASGATLDDLPNGLENGVLVEVEGTFDGTNITATKVESEELDLGDSDEFEVEGLITDYVDINSNFSINGIPVNASAASFSPSGISLADDLQVEAEGSIVNGVLIATELKLRGGEIKIAAEVTAIDTNTDTFEVSPVVGQLAIPISIGTETEMKNEVPGSEAESLNIFDMNVGDFVELEGFVSDAITNSVFAEQVNIITPGEIEVQANIQETDNDGLITVLGVAFNIDVGTTFEDSNDNPIADEPAFNAAVASDALILVSDSTTNGTANKVEIE